MSETTGLSDLSRFEPRSPLASDDTAIRNGALSAITRGLDPQKPVHRRVSDMLSVVLSLSARTRRMVLPRVHIDMDVFGPNGKRALRIYMPDQD